MKISKSPCESSTVSFGSFGPNVAQGYGYTHGAHLDNNTTNPVLHSNIVTNIHTNGNSASVGIFSGAASTAEYSIMITTIFRMVHQVKGTGKDGHDTWDVMEVLIH